MQKGYCVNSELRGRPGMSTGATLTRTFVRFQLLSVLLCYVSTSTLATAQIIPPPPLALESVLHSFACPPIGSKPNAGVVRDSAGNLYGTARLGGAFGAGVVYKVTASGQASVLYSFSGGFDGANPWAGLLLDAEGNLYGTTIAGGWANAGVVFKVDQMGHETVLYSFTGGADGSAPSYGSLVRDSAGNLYGATTAGGPAYSGVVYKLSPDGRQTVLHGFTGGAGGWLPLGGVVLDSAGNLYGTTLYGGSVGGGVVFKVSSTGQATILYNFTSGVDGGAPSSGVVRDAAGNLYGTTQFGGTGGRGVVYRIDPGGHETVLYNFTGGAGGGVPTAGVILDAAGNLYGTTEEGGAYFGGVVFKISAGQEKVLHEFQLSRISFNPHYGSLLLDSLGNLYGTTSGGGTASEGSIFKLDAEGRETILYSFPAAPDGANPYAGLSRDSAGNLYGTTYQGGPSGAGTVFKVNSNGQETVLYSFTGGIDGGFPYAGVITDSGGNVYGTTYYGGIANAGLVFKVDPNGHETVLYSFSGQTDGGYPYAGLIRDSAGNLYGTARSGGRWGRGVVYKLDAGGQETVLYSFTGGADGGTPEAGVISDPAGNLYGTASFGGSSGWGVVYKLDRSGQYTVLHSFTNGSDGAGPYGGVIRDSAGNLYGTTYSGGTAGAGVAYKIDASGNETVLYTFRNGADGGLPRSGLVIDAAGNLFGTTLIGGWFNNGVVFTLNASGRQTVLHNFAGGSDGSNPYSGLVLDPAGNLYGTTYSGGKQGSGTVYRVQAPFPPQILVTKTLTRDSRTQQVTVTLRLSNAGGTSAPGVQLSTARIGAVNATPLPQSIGTISAEGAAAATVTFPASVGSPGAAVTLTIGGTYVGGSFTSASKVILP